MEYLACAELLRHAGLSEAAVTLVVNSTAHSYSADCDINTCK